MICKEKEERPWGTFFVLHDIVRIEDDYNRA